MLHVEPRFLIKVLDQGWCRVVARAAEGWQQADVFAHAAPLGTGRHDSLKSANPWSAVRVQLSIGVGNGSESMSCCCFLSDS